MLKFPFTTRGVGSSGAKARSLRKASRLAKFGVDLDWENEGLWPRPFGGAILAIRTCRVHHLMLSVLVQ